MFNQNLNLYYEWQNLFYTVNRKQSEMVLELTRYVTQQVMEQRGLVDRTKIPNLRALMKGDNQTNNVVVNNTIGMVL